MTGTALWKFERDLLQKIMVLEDGYLLLEREEGSKTDIGGSKMILAMHYTQKKELIKTTKRVLFSGEANEAFMGRLRKKFAYYKNV